MYLQKIALSFACMLLSLHSFCQVNFHPGTIRFINGSSVEGWVGYEEWKIFPDRITFKASQDGMRRAVPADSIARLEITGLDVYERHFVSMTTAPTGEVTRLLMERNTDTREASVMLRQVQSGGILSLFSYEDRVKKRFYIKKHDTEVVEELLFLEYRKNGGRTAVISERAYNNQLLAVALQQAVPDIEKLKTRLQHTGYYESDLVKAVNIINGREAKVNTRKKSLIQFYAGAAILRYNARYSGFPAFDKTPASQSYFPLINAGLNAYRNAAVRRSYLHLDLSASMARSSFEATLEPLEHISDNYIHEFEQLQLQVAPQYFYGVYNTARIQINLGVGLGANLSLYTKNEFTFTRTYEQPQQEQYVENEEAYLNNFRLFVPLRAGVTLVRRFDCYAQFNQFITGIDNYAFRDINCSSLQVGLNYLF